MKKNAKRNLKLSRETLRPLEAKQLDKANGGEPTAWAPTYNFASECKCM